MKGGKIAFILLLLVHSLSALSISELMNALKKRPQYRLDLISVEKSSLEIRKLEDKKMPKIDLFASYELFNTPNGLVPVAPNNMMAMVKEQDIPQPFGKSIFREGVSFSWPLFIASLQSLRERAGILLLAEKERRRMAFLEREALLLGTVSRLNYLRGVKEALNAKRRSILTTIERTRVEISSGRKSADALLILRSRIDELDISIDETTRNMESLSAEIEKLTGMRVKGFVRLSKAGDIDKREIFSLKEIEKRVKAAEKSIEAARESRYPTLSMKGNYSFSQTDAYNNGKAVEESFGSVGLYLSMPIYDSSIASSVEEARLTLMKEQNRYLEAANSLKVEAKRVEREIEILEHSLKLARKNMKHKKELLQLAKAELQHERIRYEEYLRYEDSLAEARALYYKYSSLIWQSRARLAVIYGNDLKGIVK